MCIRDRVKAALRAIPILKEVGITTKVINMRPHKDPDEFIKALGAEPDRAFRPMPHSYLMWNSSKCFNQEVLSFKRTLSIKRGASS